MKPQTFRLDSEVVDWLRANYKHDDEFIPNDDRNRFVTVYVVTDKRMLREATRCIKQYSRETGIQFTAIEELAVMEYGENDGYAMHADFSVFDTGPVRKISLVVQLSEPDEYDGGELVMHDDGRRLALPKGKGIGIMFPSWMQHEVQPVTSGTRLSLVAWAYGDGWR